MGEEQDHGPTPAVAPEENRDTNEDFECTPEVTSLHGEVADVGEQFLTWGREMYIKEDSTLKMSVILSIDEVLIELGFFTSKQITTKMNCAFVKALFRLDDDVETGDSLLADLTYELHDDEALDDVLRTEDEGSLSIDEIIECSHQENGIEPSPPVGTRTDQQDNDAKTIGGSIHMETQRWMRTEESANQDKDRIHTNFDVESWMRLLRSDDSLKEGNNGKENIVAQTRDDGIVPDSQEDPGHEDTFEIPCTQMIENTREYGDGWASIPVADGRKVDVFEEMGILSGLHATADCDGFTHSVKNPDNEVNLIRDKDKNERRRSKRLAQVERYKPVGAVVATRGKTNGTVQHGSKSMPRPGTETPKLLRLQYSTPKKARPATRSADEAGIEKKMSSTAKKRKHPDSVKNERKNSSTLPEKFRIPPDQAGCSKCRFSGCRRCRGYTLAEYREYMEQCQANTLPPPPPRKSQSSPAKRPAKIKVEPLKHIDSKKKLANIFGGIHFMVSVRHSESKDTLTQMIKDMGGNIIEKLPTLKQMEANMNKQLEPRRSHQVFEKVLVASNSTSRTLKCIFARVMGIPIVSQEWVYDCHEKCRLGGFRKRNAHVYVEKCVQPVGRIFEGLDILLLTEPGSAFTKDLSVLIQSLGGNLLKSLDTEFGKCDLVLYSDTNTSSGMKAEIGNVERMARRFRIPSHPLSWLTQGIVDGSFSPEIPNKRFKDNTEEIQATLGTPFDETIPAQRPPLNSAVTRDEFDASEAQVSHRNRQNASKGMNERNQDNQVRNLYSTLTSLNDIMCPWALEGQMHDPPHGLRKSPIRVYYEKAVSIDDTINIGDFVQLLPDPGEKYPKVAKVLGLWKQLGRSGQNRLFGKFQRYYRFNETSIRQMQITKDENTNNIFQTDHIDDNVPLATVISTCHVEMLQYQREDTHSQHQMQKNNDHDDTLYCTAMYDYETGALLALHDD